MCRFWVEIGGGCSFCCCWMIQVNACPCCYQDVAHAQQCTDSPICTHTWPEGGRKSVDVHSLLLLLLLGSCLAICFIHGCTLCMHAFTCLDCPVQAGQSNDGMSLMRSHCTSQVRSETSATTLVRASIHWQPGTAHTVRLAGAKAR